MATPTLIYVPAKGDSWVMYGNFHLNRRSAMYATVVLGVLVTLIITAMGEFSLSTFAFSAFAFAVMLGAYVLLPMWMQRRMIDRSELIAITDPKLIEYNQQVEKLIEKLAKAERKRILEVLRAAQMTLPHGDDAAHALVASELDRLRERTAEIDVFPHSSL